MKEKKKERDESIFLERKTKRFDFIHLGKIIKEKCIKDLKNMIIVQSLFEIKVKNIRTFIFQFVLK